MKRYLLTAILILASCSLFAACPLNEFVANAAIPCVSGLSATPANVTARVWVQGLNNPTDGSGTDSDGIPSVDASCAFDAASVMLEGTCAGAGAGDYFVYTDWLTLAYDGCPLATGAERAVLLAYDTNGNYTLQSRLKSQAWGTWDSIGTIAAAPLSAETAPVDPDGTGPLGPFAVNGANVDINFTAFPASVLYGSYEGAAPATPIPTQYRIYFYETTGAVAPANFATSAWTAGTTQAIGTTLVTNEPYPAKTDVNNRIYVSRALIFEGIEMPFVSTNAAVLMASNSDPSGAPAINGLSAARSGLNTLVSWTSGDESQVTGYQVFWAPQGGEFSAVGSMINPVGNSNDYTATVRIPATSTFTVKVGAYLTNGSVTYSAPASVKATNIIHDKTRVTVD